MMSLTPTGGSMCALPTYLWVVVSIGFLRNIPALVSWDAEEAVTSPEVDYLYRDNRLVCL
jgi:hypothetical protein